MDDNLKNTKNYYLSYDVENRIKRDQAHNIEFLLTMDTITEILDSYPDKKAIVADIGCGTGNYTISVSIRSHTVFACDLMDNLLAQLKDKAYANNCGNIVPICTNAEDLSAIQSDSCDLVLCMGPMYHLSDSDSRRRCIQECKRIARNKGVILFTYLNPRALWANIKRKKLTILEFEKIECKDHVFSAPFFFVSPNAFVDELSHNGLRVYKHQSLDAFSSFILDEVNSWEKNEYQSWLRIVRKHCCEPSWIEFSSHSLVLVEVNK